MRRIVVAALLVPLAIPAQTTPASSATPFTARPYGTGSVKVGPPNGTVIVAGGGSFGPELFDAFITAAGGHDALILDVPNAGGATTAPPNSGQAWRDHGAKNVAVLFTKDRRAADSDSFTTIIRAARGIWFEGGRQFHLVEDYGGTRSERAFMDVLDRGGVVGGSSAGASILGDFMVRGAPSNDNTIMDYPGYETGFGYLRNVGIDQHVVARQRLPDLADSIVTRYPTMLAISADEGTAWVIRGDTGRIIGRSKAFVYNGRGANDPGAPFLTLYPGDRYDLAARRVISRASDRVPALRTLVDSMFGKYDDPAVGGATVVVAQNGEVLIDRAFGIPPQRRYMPRTTLPLFPLGDISGVFTSLCAQLPPVPNNTPASVTAPNALQGCVARVAAPVGIHYTSAPDTTQVRSDVDELYRLALGLDVPATWRNVDHTAGWTTDVYRGATRLASYATSDGRRAAFVRVPERRATVIILTNDPSADARGMAERILDRLLARPAP